MILIFRVIDEQKNIDLPAGSIVISIIDKSTIPNSQHVAFMTSAGKIVKIQNVSMTEMMTDDPSWNISNPTRELRIFKSGSRWWYKNGLLHRDAQPGQSPGPAIEWRDGTKEWWLNGKKDETRRKNFSKTIILFNQ